jgi:serine phosphatase RsbU (regulator of sigma subunit)
MLKQLIFYNYSSIVLTPFKRQFFAILDNPAPTASKLIEQIKCALYNHMDNAPQFDDITMLTVHREQ